MNGLIIDNFAGGGGASTGIEAALDALAEQGAWPKGRGVDVAINHDPEALAMHAANHPGTLHLCQSVWKADPVEVVRLASLRRGSAKPLPVDFAWFSPDCKHFSKAKGGKPVEKRIRDLAWVVVLWAERVNPNIIALENVEEFRDWGPLITTEDGKEMPCPIRKGFTFRRWVKELKKLGYAVEWRERRACDSGAPTIRKRLYVLARRDGKPIVWPAATHGPGLQPYRTAAECIDWSLPVPSIFGRAKPLASNTQRRIARGVKRYVLEAAEPFIVGVGGRMGQTQERGVSGTMQTLTSKADSAVVAPLIARIGQTGGGGKYSNGADEPVTTITTKAEHLLVAPSLVQTGYGERPGQAPRSLDLHKPLGTAVAGGVKHALTAAFLAQHNGGAHNEGLTGRDARDPLSTITGRGTQQQIVAATLSHQYSSSPHGGEGDPRKPLKTVTAGGQHAALVNAHLIKYYGTDQDPVLTEPLHTITTKDRFGCVTTEAAQDGLLTEEQRYAAWWVARWYDDFTGAEQPAVPAPRCAMLSVTLGDSCYAIVDIGMRMLTPRELFNAQGFPPDYIIDRGRWPDATGSFLEWRPITKTGAVHKCGNSVSPVEARAMALANLATLVRAEAVA